MVPLSARTEQSQANPLLYVCLAFLLMGFLFGLSMIFTGGEEAREPAPPVGSGGGGGGIQHLFPGAPVTGISPVPQGPAITVVEDVRETLNRLPLDRNNPQGWSNPGVKKPGGG